MPKQGFVHKRSVSEANNSRWARQSQGSKVVSQTMHFGKLDETQRTEKWLEIYIGLTLYTFKNRFNSNTTGLNHMIDILFFLISLLSFSFFQP